MTLAMVVLLVLTVGVAFLVGFFNRPLPAEPKPFGLNAFEAHGLRGASADVLQAVVATISFLGHPFTVVEEADEERVAARARAVGSRSRIDQNLGKINVLRAENVELEGKAHSADERAGEMDALIAQVSSVVDD